MIAAPWPDREEWQQRHRQAADVMREFQRGSDEVYQAAPKFVPPEDGRIGTEDEVPDRDRERKPEQREQQPDDGRTVAASDAPAAGGSAAGSAGSAPPPVRWAPRQRPACEVARVSPGCRWERRARAVRNAARTSSTRRRPTCPARATCSRPTRPVPPVIGDDTER